MTIHGNEKLLSELTEEDFKRILIEYVDIACVDILGKPILVDYVTLTKIVLTKDGKFERVTWNEVKETGQ